jgi:HK97 family phage major capsid protein
MTDKTAVEQVMTAFEEFKASNDAALAEIKKNGVADPILTAKVDKINEAIDKAQDEAKKRADELETKLNRVALSGAGEGSDAEVKAAALFSAETGEQVDVEGLRAYKAGLLNYMRKGAKLSGDEIKTMSVGSDPDGGYTVTPDTSGRIIKKVYETSPMRQLASVVTIGTDRLEGINDLGEGVLGGWVGETSSRTTSGTPQLGKWEIPVHEFFAFPKATQKLLDDSMFDIEGWLAAKTADKFVRTENTAFFTGDGVGKPRGLLDYTTAATADATRSWGTFEHVATGTQASFGTTTNGTDKLIDLVYKVKAAYRQGAKFVMARSTVGATRKLKDGQGNYVWQPSLVALQAGTLLGFGITEAEDMPGITASTDTLSIAFGDFKEAYQIVDRQGIRVVRDALTDKPYVGFYTTKRVGGAALNFEAVKFLKFSAA